MICPGSHTRMKSMSGPKTCAFSHFHVLQPFLHLPKFSGTRGEKLTSETLGWVAFSHSHPLQLFPAPLHSQHLDLSVGFYFPDLLNYPKTQTTHPAFVL